MPKPLTACLCVLVAALVLCGALSNSDSNDLWRSKVHPALFERAGSGSLEFIVFLDEQADLSAAAAMSSKLEKGTYVFETLRGVADRTQPRVLEVLESEDADYRRFWIANAIWVRGGEELLERLARRSDVARLIENTKLTIEEPIPGGDGPFGERSWSEDGLGVVEWNIRLVNAPYVWERGVTGEGVVIAGIDTGYDWEHPALKVQYRGWSGVSADHNYNWHDAIHSGNTYCPPDSPEPCDEGQHGTHTMGIMVGDDGINNQIGMAPGARWIGCRCWEPGAGTDISYVTECLQWIVAPTDLSGHNPMPSMAPHVVNNSWVCAPWEGCEDPNSLRTVIENVRAAGIVVLGGVGNDGPQCSTAFFPPAIYESYFSVGATTSTDEIADFSSRGPVTIDLSNRVKPDISAPGQNVRSTFPGGAYGSWSGTSFAGPHVAGLVALLISANPELAGDVDQIEEIITETALRLPTSQTCGGISGESVPNNTFGYGRIDAAAAYELAMERAKPAIVSFGLDPSYPNPFRNLTHITYRLSSPSDITLDVYDATGRLVKNLKRGRDRPADEYKTTWNGRDEEGRRVPSGVYLCKLEANGVTRSRRIVFIR